MSSGGLRQTTPKLKLLYELESRIPNDMPPNVDATIIDPMFFLHLQKTIPGIFGALPSYLLTRICDEKGNELHIVFDKVKSASIEDCERDERSKNVSRELSYQITGPGQHTPSNWLKALRNDNHKVSLNKFLVDVWKNYCFGGILKEKKLYVTDGNVCYLFEVSNGKMVRMILPHLYSRHEEADSKMIFHVASVEENSNVVIRTADTDVLIIAFGCISQIPPYINLWLEVGLHSKNTLQYINVNNLYGNIGDPVCKSLPAYHVFTGCDYTTTFSRKGKVHPLKYLEKDETMQEVFGSTIFDEKVSEETFSTIEHYVCTIYGKPKLKLVNESRLDIFLKKYKSKSKNEVINCVRKLNGSSLPPCSWVFWQNLLRTNYIAGKWPSAWQQHPPSYSAEESRWELVNRNYEIKWFDGAVAPKIVDIISTEVDDVIEEPEQG